MTRQHHDDDQELWADVPPAVRHGLEQLRAVPDPDPVAWEARRNEFLAAAREWSPQAVTSATRARHKDREGWQQTIAGWLAPFTSRSISVRKEQPMITALVKIVVALALLGGTAGTVSASQDSLPGALLYPVKTAWEDVQLGLTLTPAARLERALAMAEERVQEAQQLAEGQQTLPVQVANRYEAHWQVATEAVAGLTEQERIQAQQQVEATLARQQQTLAQVQTQLQLREGEAADGSLQQMERTMQQTRARLGNLPAVTPGYPGSGMPSTFPPANAPLTSTLPLTPTHPRPGPWLTPTLPLTPTTPLTPTHPRPGPGLTPTLPLTPTTPLTPTPPHPGPGLTPTLPLTPTIPPPGPELTPTVPPSTEPGAPGTPGPQPLPTGEPGGPGPQPTPTAEPPGSGGPGRRP